MLPLLERLELTCPLAIVLYDYLSVSNFAVEGWGISMWEMLGVIELLDAAGLLQHQFVSLELMSILALFVYLGRPSRGRRQVR
jgi:hypothetical protein